MHRLGDLRLQMHTHTHNLRWDDYSSVTVWRGLLFPHILLSVLRPHKGQYTCQKSVRIPSWLRSKTSPCYLLVCVCVCLIQNLSWIHYSLDFIQNNISDSDLVAQRSHCKNIMTVMTVNEYSSVLLKGGCRSILRLRLDSCVFSFKYIHPLQVYKWSSQNAQSHIALSQISVIWWL